MVRASTASLALTLLISGSVAALASACATQPDDQVAQSGADLSSAESTGLYHWSEGGEVFPLFAMRALRVELDGREVPFLGNENLQQYGLMPDPVSAANPWGLPVGFTVARAPDTALISVGINCSACHMGEVVYEANGQRTRMRIDGAPGHFDVDAYRLAVLDALATNVGNKASAATKAAFFARAVVEAARTSAQFEDFDGKPDTAIERFKMLWKILESRLDGDSDPKAIIESFDLPDSRKGLLLARYYQLAVPEDPDVTTTGSNRADPFAVGSNALFQGFGFHSVPQSPMRFQPLFEMEGKSWYDYTGNTNSINQRNVIEAMAVGGVTDYFGTNPSFASSVNFPNLGNLEHAVYGIKTPAWPSALPYDATLAAHGREIYMDKCAHCHEPTMHSNGIYDVNLIPLAEIGTDDHVMTQYLTPIETPVISGDLGAVSNEIVGIVQQKYCDDAKLSEQQCLALDDAKDPKNPAGRRDNPGFTTDAPGYQADILDGVWAYGTYLHNGSVPTVADLLEPVSNRPTKFATGHVLYDPDRLGYVYYPSLTAEAKAEGATKILDTRVPGNSNAGHEGEEYGTNLPADDKKALLEYLKKHVSIKR